jgi:hypothetical protein
MNKATILEFPKRVAAPGFDEEQPLHKLAALIAEKARKSGVECTFGDALGNCRAAFAQMLREERERGR